MKWQSCSLSAGWLAASPPTQPQHVLPLLVCPLWWESPGHTDPIANGCSHHPECPWNCRSIKSQPNEKHKAAIYHFSVLEFSRQNECWFIFVLFFVVFSRSHNITSMSWERMTFSCRFSRPSPSRYLRIGDPQNFPQSLSWLRCGSCTEPLCRAHNESSTS